LIDVADSDKSIRDLCFDPSDGYVAMVETSLDSPNFENLSTARLYEIGRTKPPEYDSDIDDGLSTSDSEVEMDESTLVSSASDSNDDEDSDEDDEV
jgi:hypothetical protein